MSATINLARVRQDEGYRNELRLRAQTDLLWLAHELLGYTKVCERYHRAVADLYVQKDPRKSIEDQDPIKKRLHLDPRGTFKSTMNMADTVQWMLGFPNMAILLLSGSTKLTNAFAGEVTDHFVLAKGAQASPLLELFPEYQIAPKEKRIGCYSAPCRTTGRKEDTLMSSSIESSLSGWHFDVVKEDDPVDNRNSETATGIAKVKKNRHINRKMLMPWGFRDTAGTRYDPFDAYGEDLANARPDTTKVLIRPALRLLDGSRLTPDRFPEPEECELVFPDLLSYEFLREDYEADYSAFMTQYMNDAHGGKDIVFQLDDLARALTPEAMVPVTGQAAIVWRFASSEPGMRYAAGAVAQRQNGRLFIIDLLRGIWSPSALAAQVVKLAKKHSTRRVTIEQTPGALFMDTHLRNAAISQGTSLELNWLPFDDASTRDLRLRTVEPLVKAGRLRIAEKLPYLKELQRQFGNYGMVEENDIVDVVARLTDELPASIALKDSREAEAEEWKVMRERAMRDMVYGIGREHPLGDEPELVDEMAQDDWLPAGAAYGLEEIAPGLGV